MGSSEPLPIAEGDRRKKKKRKARATDSLPGKFEGWSHDSSDLGLWLPKHRRSIRVAPSSRSEHVSSESQLVLIRVAGMKGGMTELSDGTL